MTSKEYNTLTQKQRLAYFRRYLKAQKKKAKRQPSQK